MSKYQLRTDAFARKRLDLQGKIYNPGSQRFLLTQGIAKGQSVLEIGCGSGIMTPWLAEQVGKQGRVLAIDNSPSQIKATQRKIKKLNYTQVECAELSIFELDNLKEKFDIIHIRFVLIHLADPITALEKVYPRLKKNGRIIIEESLINHNNFCYPDNRAFQKLRKVNNQFMKTIGLKIDFGFSLTNLLSKFKLKNIQKSLFQPILKNHEEKKILTFSLHENKERLISFGILNEIEWGKLVHELENMQKNKDIFIALSSLYQVSASNSRTGANERR